MRDLVPGDATRVDLYVGQVEAGVNRGGIGLQLVILVGGSTTLPIGGGAMPS